MSSFCGYINKKENITDDKQITLMNNTLTKKSSTGYNAYIHDNIALGNNEPFIKNIKGKNYVIVYNGTLFNTNELIDDLITKGYTFSTKCDEELIVTSYVEYGVNSIFNFNGVFSFAIYDLNKNQIFFGRDRLGVKPLFYSKTKSSFVFSSEIKGILAHKDIKAILDRNGIKELFGIGPSHTPGITYFKNIFEIKPGHCGILKDFKLTTYKYWDLETKENNDTENEVIEKIHELLIDATKKQLVSDTKICSMLSGGLDSSILTKISKDSILDLTTFSIDFDGNDKDFTPSMYQGTKDSDYVKIMKDYLKTNHKTIILDNSYSFDLLKDALIARDMPGMADIDTSILAFCNKIYENGFNVCLSGECSDEIFGGYPWYYREHLISHEDGFPWALSENLRNDLLKDGILEENELFEYIKNVKNDMLKDVKHLDSDDEYQRRFRNINYLTIKYFMTALLERTDRMCMISSLEVRIPFADHRIFEYVYNLPAKLKLGLVNGNNEPVEKYVLRKAFENELPENVVNRKKSPFPKTYDPNYLKLVESAVLDVLNNPTLKIHQIINKDYLLELINTHGKNLKENLFGQLMTYPQTLAYIYQISMWLELYNIEIEI